MEDTMLDALSIATRDPGTGQFESLDLAFYESEEPAIIERGEYEGIDYEPSYTPTEKEIADIAWLDACEAVELSNEGNIDHPDNPFYTHPRADEGDDFDFDLNLMSYEDYLDHTGYAVFVWEDPKFGFVDRFAFSHEDAGLIWSKVKTRATINREKEQGEDFVNYGLRAGVRYNRPLNYFEGDAKWFRRYYCLEMRGSGQQRAPKWQQCCRTNRLARRGNRQTFETMRDDWANLYEEMLTIPEFVDHQSIPEFEPAFVGLSEEDAVRHEIETHREEAWYQAELERSLADDYEEPDYSYLFRPQSTLDQLKEVHERHLFPENFVEPEPYHYSFFDHGYYDDWDDSSYYDQYYESDPWRDEEEWRYFSQFDTYDDLEDQQRFDLVADNDTDEDESVFRPSFVGNSVRNITGRRASRHYGLRDWHQEQAICG